MAGIKVREIYTAWGFDINDKPIKALDKTLDNMKKQVGHVKWLIGGSVAALLAAAKFTADAGDEAVKTAQKVGMSTEAYQELAYAADLADIGADTLKTSLGILGTNAREAWKGGKEAGASFAALGISATNAQGKLKPASALILEMAERFSNMTAAEKEMAPALARGLLGRGGADMLPLLFGGAQGFKELAAEARNLGGVMKEDDALMGERFNDNLRRAYYSLRGVRNEIGVQLLPMLDPLVRGLTAWMAQNRELIGSALGPFLTEVGALLRAGMSAAMGLATAVIYVVDAVGTLVSILRPMLFLLTAFAAGKAILAAVSLARTLWLAVAAMQALNFELLLANAMTGFVPVLLGLGALGADYAIRGDRSIAGSLFGSGAARSVPLPGISGAGRSMTNVTEIKPQINVTVTGGSNPVSTGQAIGQAAHHEMAKMLRQSLTDLQPQVVN